MIYDKIKPYVKQNIMGILCRQKLMNRQENADTYI